ncbi:DNA binding methylated-DNA--cysteine S-methyltransferase [Dacryopinax primogenitus]|uniref:DNA binding methylated-DNA--cysteine S-methyltransferase n=1 Tax=Dacryopinax primogenitus (strain DJM 731) TaxID=1858805 RepID=M5G544_DACPD|nr:DNA binding methylated-DNA--cysteine S-methyltransferase [Dacryopinax primogenitus]EJU05381.1 DNA binding methylated-DNA--cysteine S-methyltransferase [Dacryopinax primogenitus]
MSELNIEEFHVRVYEVVRMIPHAHVTSYGHIAKLIGMPRHSRHVGQALKWLPEGSDIPWQRVISSSGQISSRGPATEGAQLQREALEAEGVEVTMPVGGGTGRVNFREYGWFPDHVDFDD